MPRDRPEPGDNHYRDRLALPPRRPARALRRIPTIRDFQRATRATPHNTDGIAHHARSSEQTAHAAYDLFPEKVNKVADMRHDRYEDGEVRRFGAGESYRPFNSNSDRKRSPAPRARSPPPRAADRGRTPPHGSDSYVPGGRSPRRRSRSLDRFRRERSRERMGADTWRRRERSRSRVRSPPRRSPVRRSPPPPRRSPPPRFTSPRRDERPRSPRRDFDVRDNRFAPTNDPFE
jgi:hypothetical protein